MSYAIMRVQKLKSHQVHFSQNHNERNHENHSNPDIDLEKSKDNYHLMESKNYSKDTEHIIQKNYKGSKNIRKDAIKNVEIASLILSSISISLGFKNALTARTLV